MTLRIASLGMYDHPAQQGANDRLWAGIAAALRESGVGDVPDRLDRTRPVQAIWRDPALLFGQACGYPLLADSTLALRVLAFPVYAPGPVHAAEESGSVVVARRDDPRTALSDFRGARAAINDRQSNTGMNLFRATLAPIAWEAAVFARVIETGAHRASIAAIVAGEADIAAIDVVTLAALARFEPALTDALKTVARSPASPTLPFVTAASTDADTVVALRRALDRVIADPALEQARATLFLAGVVPGDTATLAPLARLATDAARAGYPDLR